jgi:hypothetical protein
VVRGRDLEPFRAAPRRVVLWGYDSAGRPLPRLPPLAAAYLTAIRKELDDRSDRRDGPPWALFRLRASLARWRVVWPDIARRPAAVALDEIEPGILPLNTCYVAPCPDRETALVVAAVLGSTWSRALVRATADEARGGYRRYNARITGPLPIPEPGPARDRAAELSRAAHHSDDVAQTDLDRAVADALGLPAAVRDALRSLAHDPG